MEACLSYCHQVKQDQSNKRKEHPMQRTYITFITIFALSINIAQAQEGEKTLNFMNQQLAEQLLNQTLVLSEASLVKARAELLRKHYDALIQTGFTKDEALQIVVALASRDND